MMETIITPSVLILIIIALRYLLRGQISSQLQYALWMLVAIRLLLPFPLFENPVSVMNIIPDTQTFVTAAAQPAADRSIFCSHQYSSGPKPEAEQAPDPSTRISSAGLYGRSSALPLPVWNRKACRLPDTG